MGTRENRSLTVETRERSNERSAKSEKLGSQLAASEDSHFRIMSSSHKVYVILDKYFT